MTLTVSSLHAYPVKSLRGHDLSSARVLREGFEGDRRWVVTDTNGRFLTQREVRAMAQISVRFVTGGIELSHADAGVLTVPAPGADAESAAVTVWRFTGAARRANREAEAWLSAVLARPVWLAHMHDVSVRGVNLEHGTADDRVSFADGYPILIATTASLHDLNARGGSAHSMRQFRPNLVVDGTLPWAEDTWVKLRIGSVTLRVVKPCERCVMTTLDPDTGAQMSPSEPLRTLGTFHRTGDGRIIFGQNAIPDGPGEIKVGDVVEVMASGSSSIVSRAARSDPFAR